MAKEETLISKWQLFFIGSFFVTFLVLLVWNSLGPRTMLVMLDEEPLNVYVADTLKNTYVGLGGRDDLGEKDGMMFLFDFPGRHGIVMRDMQFPIDIIWLYEGTVVDMVPAAPIEPGVPEYALTTYYPRTDATMVIELSAGWAAEHDLKIGDTLRIP